MKTGRRHPGTGAAGGFSLIEVIVALIVISGFGAALFVWAGQTLQTATRAAQVQEQAELERNITELAFSLNPALQPSGRLVTATHRYEWQATATNGPTDQVRLLVGVTPWQAGLYSVRVTVSDLSGAAAPVTAERMVAGYRQVRIRQSSPFGAPGGRAAP